MDRTCGACYWYLGDGCCSRNYEPICALTQNSMWMPIAIHATAVDAARYMDHIAYRGPGVHITARADGKYDLRLEGLTDG